MNDLLITSIRSYEIASLIFTTSAILILTSFVCYLIINMIRLIFRFNHKAERHFLSINRALGIVAAIFTAFLIVAIVMNHF